MAELRQRPRSGTTKTKPKPARGLLLLFGVLFLGLIVLLILLLSGGSDMPAAEPTDSADGSATLMFVGDISMTEQMQLSCWNGKAYDYATLFQWVTPLLSSADLTVGNLEGNITDESQVSNNNYPVSFLTALYDCGFDVLQTANSYSIANGITGLTRTRQEIEAAGMDALGTFSSAEEKQHSGGVLIREVNGIRIALIGLTKGMNGMRIPDSADYCVNLLYTDYDSKYSTIARSAITALVENAKAQQPDLIIVMAHWGSEYSEEITGSQEKIASMLLDQGVDLIIGSHSHCVGPIVEKTSSSFSGTVLSGLVAYSLGDFLSSSDDPSNRSGCILQVKVEKKDGMVRLSDVSYVLTYSCGDFEALESHSYEILNVNDALKLYQDGYYDKISEPLYQLLRKTLKRTEKQIHPEETKEK